MTALTTALTTVPLKVVISRYKEDISWANGISHDDCHDPYNVLIYHKSDTPCESPHPVVSLPNVGREGHTYAYHILTHYDTLDDYTVFLQGYPFDHSPQLETQLREIRDRVTGGTQPDFQYVSQRVLFSNLERCPYDITLNMVPTYEKVFGSFDSFGTKKKGHPFVFGAGAQFVVSRAAIQSRPRSFYENLCRVLDYDVNPIEGFSVERFWQMIFTHSE
jgi:hypothetical protein